MKQYPADKIFNVAVLGHSGAGKTTFVEAALFNAGKINRMGRGEDGTLVADFDEEEKRRHITINTTATALEWNGSKLNLLDTPGEFDFLGEVQSALRVAGSALILVNAKSGVEVGVEKSVRYLHRPDIPYAFLVNHIDDDNADYRKVIGELKETEYGRAVQPFMMPIIESDRTLVGFVDIIRMKAYTYKPKGELEEREIPDDMQSEAEALHEMLVESAAESDDELMMKFFEGEEFTEDEFFGGIRKRVQNGHLIPVWYTSSTENLGVKWVLDQLIEFMPAAITRHAVQALKPDGTAVELTTDPEGPLAAFVFKTISDPFVGRISLLRVYSGTLKSNATLHNAERRTDERIGSLGFMIGKDQYNVDSVSAGDICAVTKLSETMTGDTLSSSSMPLTLPKIVLPAAPLTMAIFPEKEGEEDRIAQGLARLNEEDPTFKYGPNPETKQLTVSGVGEVQLNVLISKLKNKFKVNAYLEEARVPYRETIRSKARVQGRHRKQTGGHGQFGDVWIEFEPNPAQEAIEFAESVFGGSVPRNFFPAVEKGLQEAAEEGILAGYPVVNVKATLVDGSYHDVDSSELAFKLAARLAYRAGMEQANAVIMEPWIAVEVNCPEPQMGDILGDLNRRRGRISNIEPKGERSVIHAEVPMAEMGRYATDLRSMTQGRGWYSAEFARYETMQDEMAKRVIQEAEKRRAE